MHIDEICRELETYQSELGPVESRAQFQGLYADVQAEIIKRIATDRFDGDLPKAATYFTEEDNLAPQVREAYLKLKHELGVLPGVRHVDKILEMINYQKSG